MIKKLISFFYFRKYFNFYRNQSIVLIFILLCWIELPGGNGKFESEPRCGQQATIYQIFNNIYIAAKDAFLAPGTFLPLAGSILFQLGDFDKSCSYWISENTPLFGSQENADKMSNHFRTASRATYFITALSTPCEDKEKNCVTSKLKGLSVGLGAIFLTKATTSFLKDETNRLRPNKLNNRSFPSGHISNTAVHATLASKNIRYLPIKKNIRRALCIGLVAMTTGTAWARVEAKMHYPSDVLAGAALGHFLGSFINDVLLGNDQSKSINIIVCKSNEFIKIEFQLNF